MCVVSEFVTHVCNRVWNVCRVARGLGCPWAVAAGAAVPVAVPVALGRRRGQAAVKQRSYGRMESWHLWPGTKERGLWGGRRAVGPERVSRRPSPALGAPENASGGHFLPEGDVRGFGAHLAWSCSTQDQVHLRFAPVALPWAGIRNVPKSDSLLLLAKLYLIQWVFPCTVDFPNVINFNIK